MTQNKIYMGIIDATEEYLRIVLLTNKMFLLTP